jgi:hypothetical protein
LRWGARWRGDHRLHPRHYREGEDDKEEKTFLLEGVRAELKMGSGLKGKKEAGRQGGSRWAAGRWAKEEGSPWDRGKCFLFIFKTLSLFILKLFCKLIFKPLK